MVSCPRKKDLSAAFFYVGLGVLAVAFVAIFLRVNVSRLVTTIGDGGGYYLQVARNAAQGHGLTFDGMHGTNGFHPLWMALLVGLFKTVPGDSELHYRLAGLVNVGLILIACLLFHRAVCHVASPVAAAAGSAVYAALAFLNINMMESSVVLVAISALCLFGWGSRVYQEFRPLSALGFGLLLGLAILARLDVAILAFVIGVVGLIQIFREAGRRSEPLWRLSLIVLGSSLLVLPYLWYNYHAFGSIVPISGRLESSFPHGNFAELPKRAWALGRARQLPLIAAVMYVGWYLLRGKRDLGTQAERQLCAPVAVLALASLLHAANELLFLSWQFYWHFALLIPLTGLLVVVAWQLWLGPASALRARAMNFAVLAVVLMYGVRAVARFIRVRAGSDGHNHQYDTALWIRNNTDKNTRLAMLAPEVIGFFSERQTVDLAGLCNNMEFQQAIHQKQLLSYLARSGVAYLVQPWDLDRMEAFGDRRDVTSGRYESARLRIPSGFFGSHSDPITLRLKDEVHRSGKCSPLDGNSQCVVVWRIW